MGSLIRELILVVARVVNWSIIGHIFALCILLFLVVIPSFWVFFLVDCCLLVRVALLKIPETYFTMFFFYQMSLLKSALKTKIIFCLWCDNLFIQGVRKILPYSFICIGFHSYSVETRENFAHSQYTAFSSMCVHNIPAADYVSKAEFRNCS